jgi:hypothetical protein
MIMTRSLLLFPLVLFAQACGPEMYVMTEFEEKPADGPWVYMGGGCQAVGAGSSGGSGMEGDDGAYSMDIDENEVTIRVFDSEQTLVEEHQFGRDVLESGEKERVSFVIGDRGHRITFWGGPECVSPREPDQDAVDRAFAPRDAGAAGDAGR